MWVKISFTFALLGTEHSLTACGTEPRKTSLRHSGENLATTLDNMQIMRVSCDTDTIQKKLWRTTIEHKLDVCNFLNY